MSPTDIAEEAVLLSLLAALAISYVAHRVQLALCRRDVKRILTDLDALDRRLAQPLEFAERFQTVNALQALEVRLTGASRKLLAWRASPVERWIIGRHVDPLLYDYERAGAKASRLLAVLAGRAGLPAISG